MDITWKYVKALKDENAVKKFLNQYGVNLPMNLISIIEKNNGGRPSEKSIITETKQEYVFKSLLSYNKDDLENIYSVYPESFKSTKLYPLGTDAAGNFVCFDYCNNKYVLLNHETNKLEAIITMNWI